MSFWILGMLETLVCVWVSMWKSMQKVISSDSLRIRSRRRITWLRSNSKLKENLGVFFYLLFVRFLRFQERWLESFLLLAALASPRVLFYMCFFLLVCKTLKIKSQNSISAPFSFPLLRLPPHVELKSFQIFSSSSSTLTWKPSYVQDPNCKGCEIDREEIFTLELAKCMVIYASSLNSLSKLVWHSISCSSNNYLHNTSLLIKRKIFCREQSEKIKKKEKRVEISTSHSERHSEDSRTEWRDEWSIK